MVWGWGAMYQTAEDIDDVDARAVVDLRVEDFRRRAAEINQAATGRSAMLELAALREARDAIGSRLAEEQRGRL